MRNIENLIGKRYEKLFVIEQMESTQQGQRRWLCKCDCGGTCVATTGNLNSGRTTNCGCKKSPDLAGKVFGKLTVLGRSDKRNSRGKRTTPMWECRCECGAITYKATDTLTNSATSMCKECAEKYAAEIARQSAGFVGGTQITKIMNMTPTAANTSGVRGVYYEKRSNKWRARLSFKGKTMSLGSFARFEDAVSARKEAERVYFGEFLVENGLDLNDVVKEVAKEKVKPAGFG